MDKREAFPVLKCIQLCVYCRMGRWSFWCWFNINLSTFWTCVRNYF